MKKLMALVAILIILVGGAAIAAPPDGNQPGREVQGGGPTVQDNQAGREVATNNPSPVAGASPAPAAPVYISVPGAPGGPGPRGSDGIQGPPGPPPADQQVEKVVEKVLAAMDGEPVPESYLQILEAAGPIDKLVVGYPDGEWKWNRRATRAEVVLIVTRFRDDLEAKLGTKIEDLEKEIRILAGTDARHDRSIRVLMAETRDLREEGKASEERSRRFVLWIALIILAGVIARTEPEF